MSPERRKRVATALLTFCALLVLTPSRVGFIWEHAPPAVRVTLVVPLIIFALQVLAFVTHQRWLMVLGILVATVVALAALLFGGLSFIIASFTGNSDLIFLFFVVGAYGAVVAAHLGFSLTRHEAAEVAAPPASVD